MKVAPVWCPRTVIKFAKKNPLYLLLLISITMVAYKAVESNVRLIFFNKATATFEGRYVLIKKL